MISLGRGADLRTGRGGSLGVTHWTMEITEDSTPSGRDGDERVPTRKKLTLEDLEGGMLLKFFKSQSFQSLNLRENEVGITNKMQSRCAANVEITIYFFRALLFT